MCHITSVKVMIIQKRLKFKKRKTELNALLLKVLKGTHFYGRKVNTQKVGKQFLI